MTSKTPRKIRDFLQKPREVGLLQNVEHLFTISIILTIKEYHQTILALNKCNL